MGFIIFLIIVGVIVYSAYNAYNKYENNNSQNNNSNYNNPQETRTQNVSAVRSEAYIDSSNTGIEDDEMCILSMIIAQFSGRAYMIYSYNHDAEHIFNKVKEALNSVYICGSQFKCNFDNIATTSGVILLDEIETFYNYALITNKAYGCDAVILYGGPTRSSNESDEEWERHLRLIAEFDVLCIRKLQLDSCTLEEIQIPRKTAAAQNNGFSFGSGKLAQIYKTSKVVFLK